MSDEMTPETLRADAELLRTTANWYYSGNVYYGGNMCRRTADILDGLAALWELVGSTASCGWWVTQMEGLAPARFGTRHPTPVAALVALGRQHKENNND